jgi:hypothetical protein
VNGVNDCGGNGVGLWEDRCGHCEMGGIFECLCYNIG